VFLGESPNRRQFRQVQDPTVVFGERWRHENKPVLIDRDVSGIEQRVEVRRQQEAVEDVEALRVGLADGPRFDPANWKALAGPIGKGKGLNKTDEAGMLEVSDAIGNLRKNINGAAVEPKTCAREHARIVLGIEKRSDTKLRELEKISRGINASNGRTETP